MIKKTSNKTETRVPAAPRLSARAPQSDRTHKASASARKAPSASPARTAQEEVTFALYEVQAEQVLVSGVFNNWEGMPLTRRPNRDWTATLPLPPGRYEYKFLVDGKWKIDPRAREHVPNPFGTLNSVIEVKAE